MGESRTGSRVATLYAALFLALGVVVPFMPVWFVDRGLDPFEIGLVVAAPAVLRVVLTPLVAEIADRSGRPVLMLRCVMVVTLAGYASLPAADGFGSVLAANAVAQSASAAALPLLDSLLVRAVAGRPGAFGPVRVWGSVAFIVGSLAGGAALAVLPVSQLIWVVVCCHALALAVAIGLLPGDPPRPPAARATPSSRTLLTAPILLIVVTSTLIQASHGAYYGFGAVHWRALGYDGPGIALLWSLGVVAEIVLLWASARLPAGVGPVGLLAAGAAAALVRWVGMGLDPTWPAVAALQLLHALTFAATYLGTVRALAAVTPPGAEARAQGLVTTANGVAIAASIALAGALHGTIGAGMYVVMAGIGAAGALVLALARARIAHPHRAGVAGDTTEPR